VIVNSWPSASVTGPAANRPTRILGLQVDQHAHAPASGVAGLDAQLPPVVQAAADLLEPIAKRGYDRLLLCIGALFDAEPRGESGVGETAVADPAAALEPRDGSLHGIRRPAASGGVRQ